MVAATKYKLPIAPDVKVCKRGRISQVARFAGAAEAAKRLGMSRSHAWRVLSGERKSPRLAELRAELRKVRAAAGEQEARG